MRDFLTVFKYELKTQLFKKAAIITTVLMMAVMLAVTSLPRIIALFDSGDQGAASTRVIEGAGYVLPQGPEAELLSPLLGEDTSPRYPDRAALETALKNKEIEVGFVIRPDLSYEAVYLDRSMEDQRDSALGNILTQIKKQQMIENKGLTADDFAAIEEAKAQGTTTVLGRNSMNNYALSFALMVMIYMMVLLYGNGVSSIIAREKDSRTMEILITSTRPSSLILGKVAAAGVAALLQFGMVVAAAVVGYQLNKSLYPEIVTAMMSGTLTSSYIWSYVFFSFFGFILYLFLYAALGSTVSKMEDLSSATGVVQFLFIIGYMLATFAANMPSSPVAVAASIIPFTSIMVMPLRSAIMTVSWGELILSGALMLLFVVFFAFLSIKIYRWGSLNYGNKTKLSRIVKEALRAR